MPHSRANKPVPSVVKDANQVREPRGGGARPPLTSGSGPSEVLSPVW